MVVRREKKVRKCRGHRTYGYGSHKKHRGKGSRGGRGFAGMHKHKWTYTVKYAPDHFGKRGFTPVRKGEKKVIKLEEIEKMVEELLKNKLAEVENDKIKIDVTKLGYEKVIGSGKIKKPLIVCAKYFSKKAVEKIEKVGGKAVICS